MNLFSDATKRNGMQLFTMFIVIGALVFMVTSYFFVRSHAKNSAEIIIEENRNAKFAATEQFVREFVNSHNLVIKKIVEHPSMISAVLEGIDNPRVFQDQMSRLKRFEEDARINVYDILGEIVYRELSLPENVANYIRIGVETEALLEEESYSFFEFENTNYLAISSPVSYAESPEGLALYIIDLGEAEFLQRLEAGGNHWFGLAQERFDWSLQAPSNWAVDSEILPEFAVQLLHASEPGMLEQIERDFAWKLFVGLVVATSLTIACLYVLGHKLLVTPYQQLYQSERMLESQTAKLKQREAEAARLATVAKHIRDAVVIMDLDGKITWTNVAFNHLTGYSSVEAIGRTMPELVQGEESDPVTTRQILSAIDNNQSARFELVNYRKDGKRYWVEVNLTPLFDQDGKLSGHMTVERDITERVELRESVAKKAVEAETANVAKSQFLASMSHELRTPMNGILGVTELLRTSSLSEEQSELTDTLLSSGKHMLAVLNDILDFSKIEAGKLEISPANFRLGSLAHRLAKVYSTICKEKGLGFNIFREDVKNVVCYADETRLMQILQNLLNNAWKFTSEGEISVSMKLFEGEHEQLLEIEVTDTGIGIEPEKQQLIFEPFSQAERDTTRRFGGTGLGLSITFELVKAMKGQIRVESELGKGSTFFISLPVTIVDEPVETDSQKGELFDGSGLHVLIVEDNQVNIFVLSKFLERRGFSCDVANNGQIAVEKVQQDRYDLVLMDNHMPIMDGSTAITQIKALKLEHEPVIIGCTADAFQETRREMIAIGCADVVTKPIEESNIDQVLRTNLTEVS